MPKVKETNEKRKQRQKLAFRISISAPRAENKNFQIYGVLTDCLSEPRRGCLEIEKDRNDKKARKE